MNFLTNARQERAPTLPFISSLFLSHALSLFSLIAAGVKQTERSRQLKAKRQF